MKIFTQLFFTTKQHYTQATFIATIGLFLSILIGDVAYAQPTVLGTQVANGTYTTYDLVTRGGGVRFVRINATSAAAAGARNWEFATGTAASTNYTTNWRPYSTAQLSAYNTYVDPTPSAGSARYNTSSGGASGTLPAVVSGSYYTFLVGGNSAANNFMSVLSTTYNPKNITGASQSPVAASVAAGQPVVVTTTISAALTSPETVFLRYSNDGFTTSTIIAFSTSGTTLTATIPGAFNTSGATISYYIFSSNSATAPSVAQADYFTLNLYNSSGQNASGGGTNYTYTVGAAPSYTWNQTGTASWATSTNWTPTRSIVGTLDTMIFNNAATTTVTGIPVETIGGLLVSANTTVNLQPAAANALTIANGVTGADLSVASGSALNATGASALALTVGTGATGSISGNMTFSTSANTLIATDATSITFNSGSSFTQDIGNTGNVFGPTGATANGVVFASGSTFNHNAGSNPFVKTQPATAVVFQTGSNYVHNQAGGNGLAFSGRTYSNLTLAGGTTVSAAGGSAVYVDNLTISGSTAVTFTMTGTVAAISSINGNISVASGSSLTFNASGATFQFNGASQTISGAGNYTIATGQIINIPSGKQTTLQSNMTITGTGSLAIAGTVDMTTAVASGTGVFSLAAGATLKTGNTAGIASSGATGSVQTTTRTLPTTANYLYNGTANQITGTGLPATVNSLSISNTGTSPTNVVTLTAACTTGIVVLTSGKLDLNTKTFTISTGGTISATSGDFTATAGPVAFAGTATVSGTVNFPTVTMAGGVNYGSASNIVTSMQINTGGFVNTNAPSYGSSSTLIYNVASYGRSLEWSATSGAGYPYHVQVGNGTATTLDMNNGANAYRKMAGTLTVSSGSTFNINGITNDNAGNGICVEVAGDITNNGTISFTGATKRLKGANFTNGVTTGVTNLSTAVGGDLEVTGNFTDNNTFNANNRAVFFTGTGTQIVSGSASAPFNIDYIVSNKASGTIQLGVDLLTAGPNGGNAITLTGSTDILDLNGRTLTLGTSGVSSTISGSGLFKGSSTSNMVLNGTGAFGTVRFDQSTPGTSNLLQTLTLNRVTSGGFTLGNDLNVSTTLTITDGTITLGANNLTIGASGTISVTPSATKMIIASGAGQLRKVYTGNGSFLFPIGDTSANYTPATLNFTAGSYSSAYAGVNITKTKQGNNASTTDYINRFWTVATSGITTPTCTASFTYVTGDVAGTEANLYGGHYVASAWKCMGPVNTGTHTISSTVTDFGDFTAGEFASVGCCVNPTSGGTITGAQTICLAGDPAAFTSSTLPSGNTGTLQYQWQASTTSPGTSGFSDISGATSTTYDVPSGLMVTTWYKRLSKVTCSGTWASSGDSNTIEVTVSTANTWTAGAGTTAWLTPGNWSCGVPLAGSDVTISTASFYPEITSSETIHSLTIDSGTTLKVISSYNLTVTDIIANSGTLTLENNANLKQTNNVSNTGSGATIVNRNSALIMRQDYTLWSSPVTNSSFYLQAFSPMTLSNRFYTYDPSGNIYVAVSSPSTTPFALGTGYLIRVANNHNAVTPTAWAGQFTGVPNNGNVSLTVTNGTYNAIGNPYPSTISADSFISANSLTDALYFWRKTNNVLQATAPTTSYATYTYAGGAGTGPSTLGGITPNGTIQVGQGFIAKATSSSLNFTNAMRTTNNSDQFLRIGERSRIWLDLYNSNGSVSQALVAYMLGATLGIDPAIDGHYINDAPTALTSIINNEEFAVQGRPLPFDATDVVPLGFKSQAAGSFTIALNNVDGLFASNNQAVYLKDNLTNTIQDLTSGSYTFATEAGTFNTRFEITYENLLATQNQVFTENNVVVYKENQELVINSGNVMMSKVQVYDLRGRLLVEKTGINAKEVHLNTGDTNAVLIVKITSDSNGTVTKKVVN